MTPAKLFWLEQERLRVLELQALPIDTLHWTYLNKNRDPGEKDAKGNTIREPAPFIPFDKVRTRYLYDPTQGSSAAEDEWDYSLLGAKASKEQFKMWAGRDPGIHRIFIPNKEK